MKILLDIDGVMVPATSWKPAETLADGFAAFSRNAVVHLNRIIAETGASIVLTTSHKSSFSLSQWLEIFSARGINVGIERLDDNADNLSRKEEILKWLGTGTEESFVIIDDDKSLNGLSTTLKERLVLTSPMVGLNEYHADVAIHILLKETHELV